MKRTRNPHSALVSTFAAFALLLVAACSSGMGKDAMGSMGVEAGSGQDLVVNVGDRVFYALNKSNLSDKDQETLRLQAAWLKQYPDVTVSVEGHADERGTREYNIALGARRAHSAKNFLVSQGIDAGRISTVSYGKERPVALCSNETCWKQNRRAVTVVLRAAGS